MPHGDEYYRDYSTQHKVAVTINWGLPSPTALAAANLDKEGKEKEKKRIEQEKGNLSSTGGNNSNMNSGQFSPPSEGQDKDGVISPHGDNTNLSSGGENNKPVSSLGLPAPAVSALISTNIRQRLSESHSVNALLDQSSSAMAIVKNASTPSMRLAGGSPMKQQWKPGSSRASAISLLQSKNDDENNNQQFLPSQSQLSQQPRISALKQEHLIELPFTLIQVHREYHMSNPMKMVETGRRLLRSYVRVCGSFSACAKAKELADMQMEQLYLGPLYRSAADREHELLLQWNTFKGFEAMSLDDSDHFLIYCRSTPLEVASFHPMRSIFNLRFPAICKPQEQRYAVLMVNPLPPPMHHAAHANNVRATTPNKNEDNHGNGGDFELNNNDGDEDEEDDDNDSGAGFEATMASILHHSHSGRRLAKLNKRSRSNTKSPVQQKSAANLIVAAAVAVNSAVLKQSTGGNGNLSSTPSMIVPGSSDDIIATGGSNHFLLSSHASLAQSQHQGMNMQPVQHQHHAMPRPRYLSELSVIYETVVISSTRLEGLRYAIQRFGSLQTEGVLHHDNHGGSSDSHDNGGDSRASLQSPSLQQQQQQRSRLSITNIISSSLDDVTEALRSTSPSSPHSPSLPGFKKNKTKIRLPPSKISLRPLDGNKNSSNGNEYDRLLAALHHDNRKVVVMPLFKWILIDGETLSTLEFTNAFHEPNIRKVFLAEEFENSYADSGLDEQRELERIVSEAESEQADTRLMEEEEVEEIEDEHHRHVVRGHAFNDYRDFAHDVVRRRVPPQLIESFAEVGLVPKSTKNVVVHVSDSPDGEEHVEYQEPSLQLSRPLMEQARALQILEREVISREVGEEIKLLKDHAYANNDHKIDSSNGMEGLDMSLALLSEQQKGGGYFAPKDSGNTSNHNNNKQIPPEDRVKASLKKVSRSLQRNAKILQTHDQLCELENHIAKKGNLRGLPGSTIAGLGLMGAATTDPKSAVIQKRMGVIEALQKVHVQLPVNSNHSNASNSSGNETMTLASLYVTTPLIDGNNNNNGSSGGQQMGSGSKGKQVNKSSVLAAQQKLNNPSHHGPSGSSAKRITETLRLLSENLDAQLLSNSSSVGHISNGHGSSVSGVVHSHSGNSLGSHAHSKK